jgi:3-dehydroquinate dehydratase type I
LICAVCYSDSIVEIERQVASAERLRANFIEIRVDGLQNLDYKSISKLIENTRTPTILTARSEWKNISIVPPEQGRRELITNLINQNPAYIDLEFPIDIPLVKKVPKTTKIILSLLDWDGIAKIALEEAIDIAKTFDNIIVKIVATPNTVSDLKLLWKWSQILHKNKITNIVLGAGDLGIITRVKSLEMKNAWMYGKIDQNIGEPFLPGMLTVSALQMAFSDNAWHLASFGERNDEESKFCEPMFKEILGIADLNGIYINLPIKNRAELDQLLLWVNDGLLDGVKILDQWKTEVIPKLDKLDVSVVQTKEANCVVISKDGLIGYNTDIEAVKRVLNPYAIKSIKRVYIEGEELYARTFIAALKDTTDLIVVRAKDEYKLKSIIEDFPNVVSAKESFTDHFDLVVCNQYPESGFERISPLPPNKLKNARIVFDPVSGIHGISETLMSAKSLNIPNISGWDLFVNSGIVSFELWTNRSVPLSQLKMEKILKL